MAKHRKKELTPESLPGSAAGSDDDTEGEEFIVEVIEKARVNELGKWEYFVKWGGYSQDYNTWEPDKNLKHCTRLMKSFWENFPDQEEEYVCNQEITPSAGWIARETARSQKEQAAAKKKRKSAKLKKQQKRAEAAKETSMKEAKVKIKAKSASPAVTESSSAIAEKRKLVRRKSTLTRLKSDHESDDSDDDIPLSMSLKQTKKKKRKSVAAELTDDDTPLRKVAKTNTAAKATKLERVTSHNSLFSDPPTEDAPMDVEDVPEHNGRSQQSKMKRMDMPLTGSSGLATKNRLASGSPAIPTHTPSGVLTGLSFKKKPLKASASADPVAGPSAVNTKPQPSARPSRPTIAATSARTSSHAAAVSADQFVDSPQSMGSFDFPMAEPSLSTEADEFLAGIMPAMLAAPLNEIEPAQHNDDEEPEDHLPVQPKKLPAKPGPYRIPKKWKWAGDLFINTGAETAEPCCRVVLSEPTDPRRPEGLKFSFCFAVMDSIRLTKLYRASHLSVILPAFMPAQQLALVQAEDANDAKKLGELARYMLGQELFGFVHLSMNDAPVAALLICPPKLLPRLNRVSSRILTPLAERIKTTSSPLVAALLPWVLDPHSVAEHRVQNTTERLWDSDTPTSQPLYPASKGIDLYDPARPVNHHIRLKGTTRGTFQRAVHVLKFPQLLGQWLSTSARGYCVWSSPTGTSDLETAMLKMVLGKLNARDVGLHADARLVFIHVRALAFIDRLPRLSDRRCNRPEVRFYLYGTHDSVYPERWGMREIFPLGGIATFTPQAILQDPWGTVNLMERFAEHPFWACYLTAWTVGVIAEGLCEDDDPLAVFDRGAFPLSDLLDQIHEGKVSLTNAPPSTRTPKVDEDPAERWTASQMRLLGLDTRGILEYCIKERKEHCSPVADPVALQGRTMKDMLAMQQQPAMMDNFRRFVVIQAEGDETSNEALECVSTTAFSFKDDFFVEGDP